MRICYNTVQLESAITFLIANNPTAANYGSDYIRQYILDLMVEIANENKYSCISTLGFTVCGGRTFTPEELEGKYAYHSFRVLVDPSLGIDSNFIIVDDPCRSSTVY